ncbi:MAG: alpha/beta hydrolase [Planctomycetota bacterium]
MLHPLAAIALCALPLQQATNVEEDVTELVDSTSLEIQRADGGTVTVDRGLLRVPNVRGRGGLPDVHVEFHLFPCEDEDSDAPPIFFLRGGPGFRGLGQELRESRFYESNVQRFARVSDVVVVGQRGIGTSTPDTLCGRFAAEALHERVTDEQFIAAVAEASRTCRDRWREEGYDLCGFNVLEAAADVIDVADILGYEKITLVGSSFGSHWGMAIMRFHPDRVARALLSGLEGPDHTYDMPSYVLRSLERIAAAAEADERIAPHVPEGGLLAAFERTAARLDEEPEVVELGTFRVLVDGRRLRLAALGISGRTSSRRGMRTWPADMIRIVNGDLEAVARMAQMRNMGSALPTASFFCLDCGSGISEARFEELRADPAASILGAGEMMYRAACPVWECDLGEAFRADFETDIPTVLVHGTWDTSTPFDNALQVAPFFTNSRFVVVEGGSHGAAGEANLMSAEFRESVDAFLRTGAMDEIPDEVVLSPPHWVEPETDEGR